MQVWAETELGECRLGGPAGRGVCGLEFCGAGVGKISHILAGAVGLKFAGRERTKSFNPCRPPVQKVRRTQARENESTYA